jgi:pimeloyl-ACP methyl ester carboxylesterase
VTRIGLVGTAAAIPVHRDLLAAAKEEPERAYQMMTAWAHGTAAKLGGHPVPGLWMTGGTLALFARNQPGVLHADLEACHAWKSGPEAARKVRCPALVIIAANDIMTPAKAGQELARLVADSRSITVQNCGHMLPAEAPDAMLDALIDFFAPISADAR